MSISLNLKSPIALAPNKRANLSFETLKSGILQSSYESPRWPLFPIEGCFIYIEDLLFSVGTFNNDLSYIIWITRAASMSALATSPCTLMLGRWLLFLYFIIKSLLASNFSTTAYSPLSAFTELKRVRALLWIILWFKGILWLIWSFM